MYKKILVPLDGSEPSKHALIAAMESASKWDSELLILSVIPRVSALLYTGHGSIGKDLGVYENELKQIYMKIVNDAREMVRTSHPELTISVSVIKGHVPSKILAVSDREDIDLIVMGSRGLSGIESWFLGSVSKNVVEHCKKPILIVK